MQHWNAFGYVSVSMCVSDCTFQPITFENIDLETLLRVCWYIFRICRSGSYVKFIGQGQGLWSQKGHTNVTKYTHSSVIHLRLRGSLVGGAVVILIQYMQMCRGATPGSGNVWHPVKNIT